MKMFLKGEWVDRPERMDVLDPYDGSLVDQVPFASVDDMLAAVCTAAEAYPVARKLPVHRRMAILHSAVEWIGAHHEEFAQTIAREGIKTIREARKEVTRAMDTLRISAEEARRIAGETIPFDQLPSGENRFGYTMRVPIGVIGAITPFNDPLNLVCHKIGPAIAAGNCVIVKPHPQTPLSALRLAEALDQAGLPKGILQVITGGADIGEALVKDERVRMISFTGGVRTGKKIMSQVGLKKVAMELGSNAPVIVMADADLDSALDSVVSGAFWAAGQNCLHVQRLLIQDEIYDSFCAGMVKRANDYRLGSKLDESTDMGPVVSASESKRIELWIQEALDSGANLLCGGKAEQGTHFPPTLLENVPNHCRIMREEVYGPVTILIRFQTVQEAIRKANDVDYGLQAGIFTRDLQTAFQAVLELECGGVMINESTDYRIDAMPFGGMKNSGLGREGIRYALQEMTEPKVICFNLA